MSKLSVVGPSDTLLPVQVVAGGDKAARREGGCEVLDLGLGDRPHRRIDANSRTSRTARLEEAVAAFRAALEERTHERVPLDLAISLSSKTW